MLNFASVSVVLSIIACVVAANFMSTDKIGMVLDLGAGFMVQTLVLMLSLVLLFAVLRILVTAVAMSFREAQTYLSILICPNHPVGTAGDSADQGPALHVRHPSFGSKNQDHAACSSASCHHRAGGVYFLSRLAAAATRYVITERIYRSERLGILA